MKKKIENFILVIVLTFFASNLLVYATNCNGLFTKEAMDMIQEGFEIIGIAVPILLLLFGTIDMAWAVFSGDPDSMKKSTSKLVKRAIAALVVFWVPLIVNLLLNIPAVRSGLNLTDDPMCGVTSGKTNKTTNKPAVKPPTQ